MRRTILAIAAMLASRTLADAGPVEVNNSEWVVGEADTRNGDFHPQPVGR